jgi:predicted nucleic acid-binding protein
VTIDELFARHGAIALDSNVLICMLEGVRPQGVVARAIIDGVEAGRVDATTASVTLTEVLARSAAAGDSEAFERLDGDLWSIGGLTVIPMDRRIAIEAAWARGQGHGLADAIHLATARLSDATCFVTNDRRIRDPGGVEVVYLSDVTVPEEADTGSGEA